MTPSEYQVQILRDRAQWRSGLGFRLAQTDAGIGLVSSPSFAEWLPVGDAAHRAKRVPTRAVATDECGQILWVDCCRTPPRGAEGCCVLWLNDRGTGTADRLADLDVICDAADARFEPARLWVDRSTVWIFDAPSGRILGFARDTFQLVQALEVGAALDVAYDGRGLFAVLGRTADGFHVVRYDTTGKRGRRLPPWNCRAEGKSVFADPVGVAIGRTYVWVLDRGPATGVPHFVRIALADDSGSDEGCAPERCDVVLIPRQRARGCDIPDAGLPADFDPRLVEADCVGNLFVLFVDAAGGPHLVQFDADGSLLGEVRVPPRAGASGAAAPIGRVDALVGAPSGDLLLLTDLGLARFTLTDVPIGASGDYYTRTLDNGVEQGQWHRIGLRAELPRSTRLQIFAYASDQGALRDSIDGVLEDATKLPHEKRSHIETRLGPLWEAVADLKGEDTPMAQAATRLLSPINLNHDAALVKNRGRYLWLKLSLSSYEASSHPAVRELQVFHPRMSYLRYLPATYQEVPGDPSSQPAELDFLIRFLSLFETTFRALDVEIDQLFGYFDPTLTPSDFLPWLASWLDVALEEEWPRERKRALIGRAWKLFEAKGTPSGLAELIEVVTGWPVRILEDAHLVEPTPLGTEWEWRVGLNTFVRRSAVQGLRVGESSFLGGTALLEKAPADPADPFAALAYRFTVLAFPHPDQARTAEPRLRRLIDDHKPAHSAYTLHIAGDGVVGPELRIGINSRLDNPQPLRLGENTALGRAVSVSRSPSRTRLGTAASLDHGLEIT
jgi:phage tail-like protein